MKGAHLILYISFAAAIVYGRSFHSGFTGSRFGGHTKTFSSFGSKAFIHPHLHTVPGAPCDHKGLCSGENGICLHHENWKACFVKKGDGESCDKWYEHCDGGTCRLGASGKTCIPKDGYADTGQVCSDDVVCLDGNVCKPCSWNPGENRCVKTVSLGDVCSEWYQMCGGSLVCEKTAAGDESKCVCPLVCPACHIPNDTCDGCVIDEAAPTSCDPCADYDANGDDGDARCKAMNQGYCCMSDSACTSMSGILNGRLNYLLDPKTFICSDSCNSGNCDESGQKLCTVGPPIPLSYDAGDVVAEVPTCKCELTCPECYIPNYDCTQCVLDENAAPGCDPCGVQGGYFCEVTMGLGAGSCCPLDSDCKKMGGTIASRNSYFSPSTLICSSYCDSTCDNTSGDTCTFGDSIALDPLSPADSSRADTIDTCYP